jgi:D-alanyl-lipoteichoic acid acyltransferase DltB (MBOAT superfamily)
MDNAAAPVDPLGAPGTIDLFSASFWVMVAIACAVMIPLVGGKPRRLAFALINLGFLGYYLRADLVALVCGVLLLSLLLRQVESGKFIAGWLWLGGILVLGIFVMHKRPEFSGALGLTRWNPLLSIIGFSYFALRLVEVVRAVAERRHKLPGFCELVDYLLPFHMLSAGPIQSYDQFVAQPETPPPLGVATALRGIERIVSGMFKKFVLANALEAAFLTSFRADGPYFFLEMQINYIWLFLDFSAYSDIAVGIGTLMGVATPENFNRPYLARSINDFWDRFHMSLSQFIRRNVFIPIQLSLVRKTGGRFPVTIASLALAVSFLLCGLWHNIGMNWLGWGAYEAVGMITCNLYREFLLRKLGRKGLNRYLANPWIRAVAVVVTFEFVAFSLVIVTYPWSLFNLVGPGISSTSSMTR